MKIEDITIDNIKKISNDDLYSFRVRTLQLWDKYFKDGAIVKATISKENLIRQYVIVKNEMKNRGLNSAIHRIDVEAFKKNLWNIDIKKMGRTIILKSGCIGIIGDYVADPIKTKGLQLCNFGPDIEPGTIEKVIKKVSAITGQKVELSNNIEKSGAYLPLYDLVLRPRKEIEKVKIEVEKKAAIPQYKIGQSGKGILHLHIMGVTEAELLKIKENNTKIIAARNDIKKLAALILELIGDKAAHIDIRLQKELKGNLSGGSILIGNISGLEKVDKFKKGDTLKYIWKDAGEICPSLWLNVGLKAVEFITRENNYSLVIALDQFNWEAIELQDEHAKKFNFKNGIILDGDFLMAFIPAENNEGSWMINKIQKKNDNMLSKNIPIIKADEKQHIVMGVIYAPNEEDAQGDKATAEEIEKACHQYNINVRKFKIDHEGMYQPIDMLESYIVRSEQYIVNKQEIKKGSWVMLCKVRSNTVWDDIESGALTGFSMAGSAIGSEGK